MSSQARASSALALFVLLFAACAGPAERPRGTRTAHDAGDPRDALPLFDGGATLDGEAASDDAAPDAGPLAPEDASTPDVSAAPDAGATLPDVGPRPDAGATFVNSTCTTPDDGADRFQCDARVVIINPYQYRDTHLPGCAGLVTTDFNACRFMGSFRDEVYAIRLDYHGVSDAARTSQFSILSATLDDMPGIDGKYKAFILALSELPGDFLPPNPACRRTTGAGAQSIFMMDTGAPNFSSAACPITPGTLYYINVRPELPSCGFPLLLDPGETTTSVDCRVGITDSLPWGP